MLKLGYSLSSEERTPAELLKYAREAEESGFSFGLISDHFHPWVDHQGNSPFVWSVIGGLQYVVTAGLLFAGLWIAAVFLLHAPFASVDVPVLGPIPTPLVVLASLLLAGYVLARLLGAHAGMLGRRWARRLRGDLTRELDIRLRDVLFARLDTIEAARGRIADARATIERARGTQP